MSWNADDLLAKAVLYLEHAAAVERESAMYAFWCALAIELVERSSVAHVSPALLAENSQDVLYAFDLAPSGRSLPTRAVIERAAIVAQDLSDDDKKFLQFLAERRNAELHTGEAAFEGMPPDWERRYFSVMQKLLKVMGKDLSDVLDSDNLTLASELLASQGEALRGEIQKRINVLRGAFELRPEAERNQLLAEAESAVIHGWPHRHEVKCPACTARGWVEGTPKFTRPPQVVSDEIHEEVVIVPKSFKCTVCSLSLSSYDELDAAALGSVYTEVDVSDPVEHFGGVYDRYYEPEMEYDDE